MVWSLQSLSFTGNYKNVIFTFSTTHIFTLKSHAEGFHFFHAFINLMRFSAALAQSTRLGESAGEWIGKLGTKLHDGSRIYTTFGLNKAGNS